MGTQLTPPLLIHFFLWMDVWVSINISADCEKIQHVEEFSLPGWYQAEILKYAWEVMTKYVQERKFSTHRNFYLNQKHLTKVVLFSTHAAAQNWKNRHRMIGLNRGVNLRNKCCGRTEVFSAGYVACSAHNDKRSGECATAIYSYLCSIIILARSENVM